MKKFFVVLLMCFMITTTVNAANVNVQINGEIIDFTESNGARVEAQIVNDSTMVPFRKIFNKLGVPDENIEWQGNTRTIIAKDNDVTIKLQIENKIAEKTSGGITSKIELISPPIISNNRTLVPLRFIAESLGKTVAWDGTNRTAIIIDYDYFLNAINSKSIALYNFLVKASNNTTMSITRNYYDLLDSSNNNTAIINAQILENKVESKIIQNVNVSFSGTNELMKEICSEGWGNIQYENVYYSDYFTTKALNDGLKKVYGQEQMKFKYEALNCDGSNDDSLRELFKTLCVIDENKINVATFSERKNEFDLLLSKVTAINSNQLKLTLKKDDEIDLNYFDFTKFDNIIYDSPYNRVYNFLNSQLFKFDVKLDELCYDFPNMDCSILVNDSELIIDFVAMNEYNEKVEYIIKLTK